MWLNYRHLKCNTVRNEWERNRDRNIHHTNLVNERGNFMLNLCFPFNCLSFVLSIDYLCILLSYFTIVRWPFFDLHEELKTGK